MAQSPCWQYCCLLNVWASNRHRAQCSRQHVLWRGDVCFAGDTINSSSAAAEQLMRCDEHCYQVIKDKWRLTQKHGLDSGAQEPKTDGEHNGRVTAALFNTLRYFHHFGPNGQLGWVPRTPGLDGFTPLYHPVQLGLINPVLHIPHWTVV